MRLAAAGLVAVLLLLGAPAAGQEPDVRAVADTLAAAWMAGDAEAISVHLPPAGIDLSLDGAEHRGVGRRQARAALARFLEPWAQGVIEVRRAESLGGVPSRALLELVWTAQASGTPEPRTFVIFVSLERIDDDWCIQEIRLFS